MATLNEVYNQIKKVAVPELAKSLAQAVSTAGSYACGFDASATGFVACQNRIANLVENLKPLLTTEGPPALPGVYDASAAPIDPAQIPEALAFVQSTVDKEYEETLDWISKVIQALGLPALTENEIAQRLALLAPLRKNPDGSYEPLSAQELFDEQISQIDFSNPSPEIISKAHSPATIEQDTRQRIAEEIASDASSWANSEFPLARDMVVIDLVSLAFASAAVGAQAGEVPEPAPAPAPAPAKKGLGAGVIAAGLGLLGLGLLLFKRK